jgi:NTP pyrophosphatase (non-canonical NTP hydrolase)
MTAPWILIPQKPTLEDQNPQPKPVRYDIFVAGLLKAQAFDLMKLHAAIGVSEEAGELAGCIKKNIIYGKPLSAPMKEDGKDLLTHIKEEAGDVLFYLQAVMNLYGLDFQDVLQHNALKLGARYSELTYSDEAANERADKAI